MMSFIALSGAMLALTLLALALPIFRRSQPEDAAQRPANVAAGVLVVVLLPVLAIWMYGSVSTWDWDQPAGRTTRPAAQQAPADPQTEQHMAEMGRLADQLESRLQAGEGSAEDWALLGRTYANMGDGQKAINAFERAVSLSGGQDAKVLLQYGETLVELDQNSLQGKAGELFEQAVLLQPGDAASLWWSGFGALANGRLADAKQRWTQLLALNPPENVVQILQQQIAGIDAELQAGGAMSPVSQPAQPSAPVSQGGVPAVAQESVQGIRLSVRLGEAVAGRPGIGQAILFIIARQPGVMGPPVAVVRRGAAELPLALTLTDANAMMQGTQLSSFPELELVARVSMSGQAGASAGDLVGSMLYRAGDTGTAELVINDVVE